jgi:hypothetical protein
MPGHIGSQIYKDFVDDNNKLVFRVDLEADGIANFDDDQFLTVHDCRINLIELKQFICFSF